MSVEALAPNPAVARRGRKRAAPPGPPGAPAPAPTAPAPPLRAVRPLPPHGRRGVIWALVTGGAMAAGVWVMAVWLAAGAVVVGARGIRQWRAAGVRRVWSGGLLIAPLGALGAAASGRTGFGVAVLIVVLVAAVPVNDRLAGAVQAVISGRPASPAQQAAVATVASASLLALAGGSLVLLERDSVTSAAVLLALVCCYDASRYLVGTGAAVAWEGTVAGVAAVGSAALSVAVLQPTPVSGGYPWLLGAVVAASGLTGRTLAGLWAPRSRRPRSRPSLPAGRLATLMVAAPLWLLVTTLGRI